VHDSLLRGDHVAGAEAGFFPTGCLFPPSDEDAAARLLTPKKSRRVAGVIFSTINPLRSEEWAMTTETGMSRSASTAWQHGGH